MFYSGQALAASEQLAFERRLLLHLTEGVDVVPDLRTQVAEALRVGAGLPQIETEIIDPAPVDEEHKAVLWLYAEALREPHRLEGALALSGAGPRGLASQLV